MSVFAATHTLCSSKWRSTQTRQQPGRHPKVGHPKVERLKVGHPKVERLKIGHPKVGHAGSTLMQALARRIKALLQCQLAAAAAAAESPMH